MKLSRREFVRSSALAGVALASPAFHFARTGPYRTALIGSGWWGMNILRCAIQSGQSQVVGLCDVDQSHLDGAQQEVESLTGSRPRTFRDYRDLLRSEKPEIAIVATPDHWHALNTIAAVESGAHVYVEKPISHTILEGRAMVSAARRYDRVVQVGTHRRTSPHNRSAIEFLKAGKAGDVGMVRAFVISPTRSSEITPDSDPPAGLDWDLWCGPAPLRPYNRRIHPRGFRQFLEYANGTLGDWGIHWMDQILWWSEEKYPKTVASTGGRFVVNDNTNAPDTQVATFQFDSFTATWEHRMYAGNEAERHNIGCYFYGSKGTLHLGWLDGWTFYPNKGEGPVVHEDPQLHEPDDQNIPELWADFVAAIEAGRKPYCDIEIGHRSTTMSLLGMLSLKLGRSVTWDGEKEQVVGDDEANGMLRREYRSPWVYPAT